MLMRTEWEWFTESLLKPEAFWMMVTACATIALVFAAAFPLRQAVKARQTDLARELWKDFWTPRARAITLLIDQGLLTFQKEEDYFLIDIRFHPAAHRIREILGDRNILSAYEMEEDFIIPLHHVAQLLMRHAVDGRAIETLFGNHFVLLLNNEPMRVYLRQVESTFSKFALFSGPSAQAFYGKLLTYMDAMKPIHKMLKRQVAAKMRSPKYWDS